MARTLSTALATEKNQLESSHPFAWLAELDYGSGIERVTNEPQGITFQTLLFAGDVPLQVQRFQEASLGETPRLEILVGNAAQNVVALAELHWVGLLDPVWTVTLWYVDASDPDTTPLSANVGVYAVQEITVDALHAKFALYEPSISTTRMLPRERVTPNGGFPFARVRR